MNFYQHRKRQIETSIEQILLFAKFSQEYLYSLKNADDLVILSPDRPDLVLAILLGAQAEEDQFLISRHQKHSAEFLAQFENVLIIDTAQIEKLYDNFLQNNQTQIEDAICINLLQEIATDNHCRVWFQSSGSTGSAKYIQHSFQNFITSTRLSYQSFLHQFENIDWALNLSIDHIGGFMALFRSYFLGGKVTHFFWRAPDEDDTPNTFSLVPTQVHWILENQDSAMAKLFQESQLCIISGGEIQVELIAQIKKFKNKGHVVFSYGATETCSQIAVGFFDKKANQLIYRPFKNVQLQAQENNVLIQSPTCCLAIFDQKLKKISDQQVPLSDRIEYAHKENLKDHQYFFMQGRTDEIIISGGENISKQKVQNALQALAPQASFTLTGVASAKWGQELICFAHDDKDYTEELKTQGELENFEIPKAFYNLHTVPYLGAKPSQEDYQRYHRINKNPWFCFHGFMGIPEEWEVLRDFGLINIIPLNLSDFLQANSWKETAELISEYIEQQIGQQQEFNLMGYSMGARVMQGLLRPLRDRIQRVVIISSHLGDMLDHRQKQERKIKDTSLLSGIANQKQWDQFIESWYDQAIFQDIKLHHAHAAITANKQFEKIDLYKRQLALWGPAEMPNYALTYPKELWEKTLLIGGELDSKYCHYLDQLAARKKASFQKIKGHSHALLTTAAMEIADSIYKFDT